MKSAPKNTKVSKDLSHQIPWNTECLTPPSTPSRVVEDQHLQQHGVQSPQRQMENAFIVHSLAMALVSANLQSTVLSGVISLPFSNSILGTCRPGEVIFQCPVFLPFHTVHGVLKARILKRFHIPLSSGSCSIRTLHHDLYILDCLSGHGSQFH